MPRMSSPHLVPHELGRGCRAETLQDRKRRLFSRLVAMEQRHRQVPPGDEDAPAGPQSGPSQQAPPLPSKIQQLPPDLAPWDLEDHAGARDLLCKLDPQEPLSRDAHLRYLPPRPAVQGTCGYMTSEIAPRQLLLGELSLEPRHTNCLSELHSMPPRRKMGPNLSLGRTRTGFHRGLLGRGRAKSRADPSDREEFRD